MRVKKEVRKNATLLMLCHCIVLEQSGARKRQWATSYEVAHWHGLHQPNAWKILQELVDDGHVFRDTSQFDDNATVEYTVTQEGYDYTQRFKSLCVAASEHVIDWRIGKVSRGLLL